MQKHPGRYRVATVGVTTEPVTTMGGMRIVPDIALTELTPAASAMLILPGAEIWNPTNKGDNSAFAEMAGQFLAAGVPVAAICGATLGLAAAGLLNDRAHTSNAREYVAAAPEYSSEHYRDEPAVTDRGLITAGATFPVAFARNIFAELDLYSQAVAEAWFGLFDTGDPRWFFKLVAAGEAERAA